MIKYIDLNNPPSLRQEKMIKYIDLTNKMGTQKKQPPESTENLTSVPTETIETAEIPSQDIIHISQLLTRANIIREASNLSPIPEYNEAIGSPEEIDQLFKMLLKALQEQDTEIEMQIIPLLTLAPFTDPQKEKFLQEIEKQALSLNSDIERKMYLFALNMALYTMGEFEQFLDTTALSEAIMKFAKLTQEEHLQRPHLILHGHLTGSDSLPITIIRLILTNGKPLTLEHFTELHPQIIDFILNIDDHCYRDLLSIIESYNIRDKNHPLLKQARQHFNKRILRERVETPDRDDTFLFVPYEFIDRILKIDKLTSSSTPPLITEQGQAIYRKLQKAGPAGIKKEVFKKSQIDDSLEDPQSWLTMNSPDFARQQVQDFFKEASSQEKGRFNKNLQKSLGKKHKELDDEDYQFYADEIIDAIPADATDEIKFRYIKRNSQDTRLGKKCGDCTAPGSINFENSLSWMINAGYQVITLEKGSRLLGKINITMVDHAGDPAILIDAVEVNPQAAQGKPYYKDAQEAFMQILGFLKDFAKKQKRKLVGLLNSNSSGIVEILNEYPETEEKGITYHFPNKEAQDIHGIEQPLFFYQSMDGITTTDTTELSKHKNLMPAKLSQLESEIINPLQISDPEIAALMRDRNFEAVSEKILNNEELVAQIKTIFFGSNVPYPLSPAFITSKLGTIYKSDSAHVELERKNFLASGVLVIIS